jgi:hypothetical protein
MNEQNNRNEQNNKNEKRIRFLRTALYFSFGAFMVLWILAFLRA